MVAYLHMQIPFSEETAGFIGSLSNIDKFKYFSIVMLDNFMVVGVESYTGEYKESSGYLLNNPFVSQDECSASLFISKLNYILSGLLAGF